MKNDVMDKPFPKNLFADLEIEEPAEEPEDFLPTLMYILRCITTPRDSKAILMRYKDGKSYEEIGDAFGLSKQRAHYMIQEILCKFTSTYLAMLAKGIKKYMEDMLVERINALAPTIAESEREAIKMDAYEEGYSKGYEDGSNGKKKNSANESALNGIEIASLQLSTRTYNALTRNGVRTLGDVVTSGDKLIDFEAFGKTCFAEIASVAKAYGVNILYTFPSCAKKWGVM